MRNALNANMIPMQVRVTAAADAVSIDQIDRDREVFINII